MKLNIISKDDFLDQIYHNTEEFLRRVEAFEAFVVKEFYPKEDILNFRNQAFQDGLNSEPSWHPCYDGCPDFHRIHDNYPKAHVKSIMHAFYRHGYYEHNNHIFDYFSEIFDVKNFLAGSEKGSYIKNIPSELYIARVNIHHYPKGGGYQMPHIDPVSKFAKIQTIIQASSYGEDYNYGGLYVCEEKGGKKHFIDPHTSVGDLMVLSPNAIHGVEPVDEECSIDWQKNTGRWMVMPIIIHSDYESKTNVKPEEVK